MMMPDADVNENNNDEYNDDNDEEDNDGDVVPDVGSSHGVIATISEEDWDGDVPGLRCQVIIPCIIKSTFFV